MPATIDILEKCGFSTYMYVCFALTVANGKVKGYSCFRSIVNVWHLHHNNYYTLLCLWLLYTHSCVCYSLLYTVHVEDRMYSHWSLWSYYHLGCYVYIAFADSDCIHQLIPKSYLCLHDLCSQPRFLHSHMYCVWWHHILPVTVEANSEKW